MSQGIRIFAQFVRGRTGSWDPGFGTRLCKACAATVSGNGAWDPVPGCLARWLHY